MWRRLTPMRILSALGVILLIVVAALAFQPPGDNSKGYKLGKVMPPELLQKLELTDNQRAELSKLENEVRSRLEKILTEDQLRAAEKFGKRPPLDKGKKGGFPPGKKEDGDLPKRPEPDAKLNTPGGIAWFTSLEDGLKVAKRTGRPILFLSAAPHCAGVSGIW